MLVPGVVEAGAGAAVLRIEVVRLPGDVRQDQQQIGRLVVADRERDVGAVSVQRGEHGDVRADRPVGGDLEPPGLPPVVAGDRAVGGERRGLDDAGEPGARGDLGGTVAAVVTDAVDVHGELLGRVHGDVEVDRLAGGRGARGDEALDLAVHIVGRACAAVGGAVAQGGVGVPGDDMAGVVEVVLAAAQPGQRALAEGVGDGMREGTRLPSPNLLRPHTVSLPQVPRDNSRWWMADRRSRIFNRGSPVADRRSRIVDRRWSCVIGAPTAMRRLSASIPSTSHNACTPSPFVAN